MKIYVSESAISLRRAKKSVLTPEDIESLAVAMKDKANIDIYNQGILGEGGAIPHGVSLHTDYFINKISDRIGEAFVRRQLRRQSMMSNPSINLRLAPIDLRREVEQTFSMYVGNVAQQVTASLTKKLIDMGIAKYKKLSDKLASYFASRSYSVNQNTFGTTEEDKRDAERVNILLDELKRILGDAYKVFVQILMRKAFEAMSDYLLKKLGA